MKLNHSKQIFPEISPETAPETAEHKKGYKKSYKIATKLGNNFPFPESCLPSKEGSEPKLIQFILDA